MLKKTYESTMIILALVAVSLLGIELVYNVDHQVFTYIDTTILSVFILDYFISLLYAKRKLIYN